MKSETPRKVRLIEVIETEAIRGDGTNNDACRIVTQYWSKDGKLLAENDPFEDDSSIC